MLDIIGVTKRFAGLVAVSEATISVEKGSITGLIGPNGAGKTTLFSMVAGFQKPTEGKIIFEGQDITGFEPYRLAELGIARTFQIVQPFAGLTVRENIAVGAYLHTPRRKEAMERATEIGERAGLGPWLDNPAAGLTVVGRKRLELARALATRPRLLLLDEVLAGLNPSEVRDVIPFIREIRDSGVTVLMIEHIMQAVMQLCETVHVLSHGKLIAGGVPDVVCRNPQVIEAYLGRGAASRIAQEASHA